MQNRMADEVLRGQVMGTHLQRDMEGLTKKILALGARVEEALRLAVESLLERRIDLAQQVSRGDKSIDHNEIEVEEECLKVLALHAPVAIDLRAVVAYLKLNNDLERAADLAANIAERAASLATREPIDVPPQLLHMADQTRRMLRGALDAVVYSDVELAKKVLRNDEMVDELHRTLYGLFEGRFQEQPPQAPATLELLSVSRYLERIADLATNIAEDVLFMVEGRVIRHQGWERGKEGATAVSSEPAREGSVL